MSVQQMMMARGYTPAQIAAYEEEKARKARMRPQIVALPLPAPVTSPPPAIPDIEARIAALEARLTALMAQIISMQTRLAREDGIPAKKIVRTISDHYELSSTDMLSDRQSKFITIPRQIAMWACRKLTPLSLTDIGKAVGRRDHSTVIHAYRKIEAMRLVAPDFAKDLDDLLMKCSQP